jgi:hypothetical protein
MARRLTLIIGAATAVLAALVAAPASATPTNVFTPGLQLVAGPLPYGIQQAEPSVRVAPNGDIFVMAPASTPIGCETWKVSPDARSFTFLGAPDAGIGGGDCDLAITPPRPGGTAPYTVSYSSLTLPNLTVGQSLDGGNTWSVPNPLASQIVLTDRQWMASDTDGTIYMSYHIVATDNIAVAASTDGGLTYFDRGLAIDTAHIAQAQMNNMLGPIVVDRSSSAPQHPLYTVFTAPRDVTENVTTADGTTYTSNDAVFLATSLDGGYTWTDSPIYIGDGTDTFDHIFPALAVDAGGGLWAAWAGTSHIYVTYRAPGTLTWTTPMQVDETGATANIFPWLAAGGSGRADLVWYGGTGTDPADPTNVWNAYSAQLVAKPLGPVTKSVTVASDHPIHYGEICTTGATCSGTTRNLLDFFQVDVTQDGRAVIAWADDHATPGAQVYLTVQCAGTSLTTGSTLTNTC